MAQELVLDMLDRLELRSDLAELAQLTPWIESLAEHYAIPEKSVFAIDLCLEEALSNVVRHGYRGETGQPIVVEFRCDKSELAFTIEDTAPHFRPTDVPVPALESLETRTPGGLGIPLMRRFADRVEWEPLPKGNRLTLVFARRS